MHTPIVNLLKHKVAKNCAPEAITELCEDANRHLNIMYTFDDVEINREVLMCRASTIANWLYYSHTGYRNCKVLIGDVPAMVPGLVDKLKMYGFQPMVLINSPTSEILPAGGEQYASDDVMVMAEV